MFKPFIKLFEKISIKFEKHAPKYGRKRSAAVIVFADFLNYLMVFASGFAAIVMLTPHDFALKSIIFAIVGFFAVIADVGLMSSAIKLASIETRDSEDYIATAGGIRLAFSALLFLAYFFLAPIISAVYDANVIEYVVVLAAAFAISAFQVYSVPYWSIRKNFKRIALGKVAYGAILLLTTIAFIPMFGLSGVFYSLLISHLIFVLLLLPGLKIGRFKPCLSEPLLKNGFPFFITLLVAYVVQNYDTALLGALVQKEELAYYVVAFTFFYPLALVGLSIQTVLLPDLSKIFKNENLLEAKRIFNKTMKYSIVALCLLAALALAFFYLFTLFFVEKYSPAFNYLVLLIIPFLLEACFSSLSTLFLMSSNKFNTAILLRLMQLFLALTVGAGLILNYGLMGAVYAAWIVFGAFSVIYFLIAKKILFGQP